MKLSILAACALTIGHIVSGAEKTPQGLPNATVPNGLGVNIHFVEPQTRDLNMIAAAGFRFVRMDFAWSGTERKKGEYDFTGFEHLVDALAARHMRPIFILDYGNQAYEPELFAVKSDEARQAFARCAAAGAAKFKGRGVIWEMWNEPNIKQFWRPQPSVDEYMALAKLALPAVHKADPRATIIAPATSTIDLKFLEGCFQQGLLEMIDGVSVHPYRGGPPETVVAEYEKVRALISRYAPKHKKNLPILSGEWGYTVTDRPAEQQGQYLAREFLINLMNGVPLSIWYDWHDDGQDPKEREHNFGTVKWDYTPKPAYDAAKMLIKELSGFRFVKRLPLPSEDDYALLFAIGKVQKIAVWTTHEPHRVSLDLEHKLEIDLTPSPQYVAPK